MWKSQRSPSEMCLKCSSNYATVMLPVDLDPELDPDNELLSLSLDVPMACPEILVICLTLIMVSRTGSNLDPLSEFLSFSSDRSHLYGYFSTISVLICPHLSCSWLELWDSFGLQNTHGESTWFVTSRL